MPNIKQQQHALPLGFVPHLVLVGVIENQTPAWSFFGCRRQTRSHVVGNFSLPIMFLKLIAHKNTDIFQITPLPYLINQYFVKTQESCLRLQAHTVPPPPPPPLLVVKKQARAKKLTRISENARTDPGPTCRMYVLPGGYIPLHASYLHPTVESLHPHASRTWKGCPTAR